MRESKLGFAEGLLGLDSAMAKAKGNPQRVFDWDKAARIIKDALEKDPNLTAEAGLEGDWDYTGGVIFNNGKPNTEDYTYLSSNWATPTLILTINGESESMDCYTTEEKSRFGSDSKWDNRSLTILGVVGQSTDDKRVSTIPEDYNSFSVGE